MKRLAQLGAVGAALGCVIACIVHKEFEKDPNNKHRDDPRFTKANLSSDVAWGGVIGSISLITLGMGVGLMHKGWRRLRR